METQTSKTCPRCNRHLPLTSSHWHRRLDGWQLYCKECQRAAVKANQRANRPHYNDYQRQRYNSIGVVRVKQIARTKLATLISTGELVRPTTCGVCGKPADRINGHHWHYDYPGIVSWVCDECHPRLDAMRRNMRPAEAELLCQVFSAED